MVDFKGVRSFLNSEGKGFTLWIEEIVLFLSYSRNSICTKKNHRGNRPLRTKHRVCLFTEHVDTVKSFTVVYFTFNTGCGIVLNHTQSIRKHCCMVFSFLQVASSLYIKETKTKKQTLYGSIIYVPS